MTRSEILESNTVDKWGIIVGPGKFEAEMLYAPHFYECASDGEELSSMEDSGTYTSLVEIDETDRTEFPEVGAAKYALVSENDQGFVNVTLLNTEADADEVRAAYERDEGEDPDECD